MKEPKLILIGMGMLTMILINLSCAEVSPPTPIDILRNPLGTSPLRKGMTKEEVVSLWGQPNAIDKMETERWSDPKEEWIYDSRYPAVPVDYNYISKAQHLYFEGDILINWKSEEKAKEKEEMQKRGNMPIK